MPPNVSYTCILVVVVVVAMIVVVVVVLLTAWMLRKSVHEATDIGGGGRWGYTCEPAVPVRVTLELEWGEQLITFALHSHLFCTPLSFRGHCFISHWNEQQPSQYAIYIIYIHISISIHIYICITLRHPRLYLTRLYLKLGQRECVCVLQAWVSASRYSISSYRYTTPALLKK